MSFWNGFGKYDQSEVSARPKRSKLNDEHADDYYVAYDNDDDVEDYDDDDDVKDDVEDDGDVEDDQNCVCVWGRLWRC